MRVEKWVWLFLAATPSHVLTFFFLRLRGAALFHKQIRFPPVIRYPDEVPDKGDRIGPSRHPHQFQAHLLGRMLSLSIITLGARAHQIIPRILPPHRLRNHVIHGHRPLRGAAVLAAMPVPLQDIPF